jgi:hypothetical protein
VWLHIPAPLLRAFVDEMGPLKAQESIDSINQVGAGSGRMSQDDHRNFISDLEREANSGKKRASIYRPKSLDEMMRLSGMSSVGASQS